MRIIENNQIVELAKIRPNDYNPKPDIKEEKDDLFALEEFNRLKKSFELNGQDQPLIVREVDDYFEIIDGEHRYYAMQELGFTHAEVKNLGKISRQDAISRLLSHEIKFEIDPVLEAKLLTEWMEAGWPTDKLLYTAEEIEQKMQLIKFDWKNIMGRIPVIEFDEIDEDREKKGEYYITLDKKNIEWLVRNYKRRHGLYALNGEKIVTELKNAQKPLS